jgi:ubiquinone/menaquinone biosynthesis C-methylase UbiE
MDEATSKIRKTWNDQAPIWYAQREALLNDSRPVHEWLVRHVAPQAGQRLVEIAAGPGDTGFMAAPHLGSGRLVTTDLAPAMLEAARTRAMELGITNVDFQLLDAQAMDLADSSFDGAICRWGYMLMPNPAQALRETRRVLKPGGRLAFAVFTGPADNQWVSIPVGVLREAGKLPPPAVEWQPGILALGDRAKLDPLIDGAGFQSVTIEPVTMAWTFSDANEYWMFLEQTTALGPIFRALPDEQRATVRAAINDRIKPFVSPSGVSFPAKCWCGLAIK